jgi:hypothetical protein
VNADITWSVDGWTGYQGNVVLDNLGIDWFVESVQGWWGGTGIRNNDLEKSGADGSFFSPPDRVARVITIDGYATCPDESALEQGMDRFNELLSDGRLHTLTATEQTRVRQVDVHLGAEPVVDPLSGNRFDFGLTVIAVDPLKYSADLHTDQTGLAQDAPGGIQWNGPAGTTGVQWGGPAGTTGLVWQAGNGNTGVMVLSNDGSADAPIRFAIAGPVSAPSIVDVTNGHTITFPDAVPSGSQFVVDTGTGYAALDGANRYPQLTARDFFVIPRRSSIEVAFRSPVSSPSAVLTAAWRDAWR